MTRVHGRYNKEMAGMLVDYPDILGFLHIHNLASIKTQVVRNLASNSLSYANVCVQEVLR
jgi:hypothetical protein